MAHDQADPNNPMPFSPPVQQVREGAGGQPQEPQQPFVHESVAMSPEAMAYQIGQRARMQQRGGLPKYNEQTPGAGPSMPPLDAPHKEGMTIGQQAALHGQTHAQQAQQAAHNPGSIVDNGARPPQQPQQPVQVGSMAPGAAPQQPPTPAQMGIMNEDLLPPGSEKDPAYIQGQGAGYAINQPNMALKYGVIRNGQHIPAQALQANLGGAGKGDQIGNRPLKDTIGDLQRLTSQQPTQLPKNDAEADAQAAQGAAAASQSVGEPAEKAISKEDAQDVIDKMDDFDYAAFRRQMNQDLLNNPEQRTTIEERLEELSLDDLIMRDRVTQEVPIIPNKFWVKFQSLTARDDLELKRLLMKESDNIEVTQRYLLDKFALMALASGVTHINNNPLPTQYDENGQFNEEKFWEKFEWVMSRPMHMLAAIGTNHTWFEIRVRRLFVTEKVKNG